MNYLPAMLVLIRLTLRQTFNNRAAWWLTAAILAMAGGSPFLLRGDGTHHGLIQLVFTYPPAIVFGILLAGTLWLGASLTAHEITTGELTSVITKPVSPACLWVGKWLGMLAFNAALLLLAAAVYLAAVTVINRPYAEASPLHGHRVFRPDHQALFQQATARHAALQMTSADAAPSISQIFTTLKQETFRVVPGRSFTWTFPIPDEPRNTAQNPSRWSLRFHFRCDGRERVPLNGRWIVKTASGDIVEQPTGPIQDGMHQRSLSLPPDLPSGPLTLTFSNPAESAVTVFFDPQEPVVLLRAVSSFGSNLCRTFFVLFCFLGAAAALALTLGTLFSMPVTVFTAFALLFAITLSKAFASLPEPNHSHGPSGAGTAVGRFGEMLLVRLDQSTENINTLLPLSAFANAYHISNHQLLLAVVILLTALPVLLAAVGAAQLSRKEFF